ncbi:unnamed protein product [Microthlaspi erraticum]|uniref:Uncharacterized protein n=1 Tax=Microthlaspi erraticum TaxID=1685480 RepID=A0A6D2KQV0_9BRAS|nr:unnamed protein product [Microthlaspi erraticum]
MTVHALPRKGNNILIHHHPTREPKKKLRRLPHIFSRVLELPLRSDADVAVEERLDCFRFVAETDGGGVRAYVVEIHPGVTKILVRTNGSSPSPFPVFIPYYIKLHLASIPLKTVLCCLVNRFMVLQRMSYNNHHVAPTKINYPYNRGVDTNL